MKLAKFSLAAIMALGVSASAADTLADAFKEGKVSGVAQAYYWQRDKGTDADIMNFGLDLSYETARYHGFGFKSTFQSSYSPFADDDAKTVFNGDMWGSGAQLSEVYLSYATGKSTAQVGRMYFATPLIYGSGSRMNRESFEGALFTNSDIPDTTITVGYVQKMQTRTDGNGDFGKFSKQFTWQGTVEDGAYTIAINNASIPFVNITAAYLDAKDLMQVGYTQAAFKKGMFGLAAQYYYSERENADDTNLYGFKADVNFGKAKVVAAYTKADDANYVYAGLGNGADYAFTGSPILSDSYVANTEAYKLGASYAITPSANIGANYVVTDDDTNEYTYTSVTADYTFSGALKGLNVALLYDDQGKDGNANELRFNANYSF